MQLTVEEKVSNGFMLNYLYLDGIQLHYFGDVVLTFRTMSDMPFDRKNRIKIRDQVKLDHYMICDENIFSNGVVIEIEAQSIKVSFEDHPNLYELKNGDNRFFLTLMDDEITTRRVINSLEAIKSGEHHPISREAIEVVFRDREPSKPEENSIDHFYNSALDEYQKEAVNFASNAQEVAIIHGPPGTGKTTTLIEIILQSVLKKGIKVLVCCASNAAIDNILERLKDSRKVEEDFVRLGGARVPTNFKRHTLDFKVFEDGQLKSFRELLKTKTDRREFFALKQLMRKRRNDKAREILNNTSIILSTMTSAFHCGDLRFILEDRDAFDLLIVDECSQSLQGATFMALPHAKKVILAGDHMQLPPVIQAQQVVERLEVSLMQWILDKYSSTPEKIMRMLKVQYRMNEKIMKWSSDSFYGSELEAHKSCANRFFSNRYSNVQKDDFPPLLMIDTSGHKMYEERGGDAGFKNYAEVQIVLKYVLKKLMVNSVNPDDIGIIAPYNNQVSLLKEFFRKHGLERIQISTVDGFQGYEKEVIIISMVRSNDYGNIGFLKNFKRNNVAVTRAKSHLVIVGNSETLSHDRNLSDLIKVIDAYGKTISPKTMLDLNCC